MTSRILFFYKHLFISILIITILLGWIFFVWYPQPLFKAVGVLHIVLLLVFIDVILGPLLGLFVYKDGKKTLKVDLFIIVCIQVLALGYGIYHIEQGRPVWIVFSIDQFEVVRKNEIYEANLIQASKEFQTPTFLSPKLIAAEFSVKSKQKQNEMFDELFRGIAISQRPERYTPLSQGVGKIKKKSQSFDELNRFNEKRQVENIIKKYPTATAWLPLKANAVDMVVLINKEKGEVVKIVDLRPWK